MIKIKQKLFSGFLVASFTLVSLVSPVAASASTTTIADQTRLGGYDQYETSVKISGLGWDKSEFVILAAGMKANLVDALAAGPLAAKLDAPILLTDGSTKLNAKVKAEIDRLDAKTIYITSGSAVIKPAVLEELKTIDGVEKVVVLGGYDQYETSVNIAKEMIKQGSEITQIAIAAGWAKPADALSASSIAAAEGMPILTTTKNTLPNVVSDFLATLSDVSDSYVIGGTAVVSDVVKDKLPGTVHRYAGITLYDTNLEVLKEFAAKISYDTLYLANGETLIDALAGVPLASRTKSAILLTNNNFNDKLKGFASTNVMPKANVVALGGTAAVPNVLLNNVTSYAHVKAEDFGVMQLSGVNGYTVGFALVGGKKASDLASIEVSLYEAGGKLLATNTATNKLLSGDYTQLSSPFNIDGTFEADGYWNYGSWNGLFLNVPEKAVITVTYEDGSAYTVDNTNLTGNPEDLLKEALNHLQPEDFGVMQISGVNGYTVGLKILDGSAQNLQALKVLLFKGETLLAENNATEKLLRMDLTQLSSPFNINGTFDGSDGYWSYGQWNGNVEDVPDTAVIIALYSNGRVYTVANETLTGDPEDLKTVNAPVAAEDFGVMQISEVNGYNVGFNLVDGKTSNDLKSVKVSVYAGDKLLAANTATNKLFGLNATQLSSPFNINGNFKADGYWNYGTWNGTILDVPTKAVIDVEYLNGTNYSVINTNLTGDPAELATETIKHVKAEDFGVMQLSGVNGYTVGFGLVDAKATDLASIEVSLYNEEKLLAKNTSTYKLHRLDVAQLSSPFNIDGTFSGDGYWNYGTFDGTITDVPTKTVIKVTYMNGKVYFVENTNLTGNPALLGAAKISTNLADLALVDAEQAFTVSTEANRDANVLVKVKVTLTEGDKNDVDLLYQENDGSFQPLAFDDNNVALYGPTTGFPLAAVTSNFKVSFKATGNYSYKLEVVTVEGDNVLATISKDVVVTLEAPVSGDQQ